MEEREKTRSSNRNWRFLFLACALLEVRNSLKPCATEEVRTSPEGQSSRRFQASLVRRRRRQRRLRGEATARLNDISKVCVVSSEVDGLQLVNLRKERA